MDRVSAGGQAEFASVAHRNNSLSSTGRLLVFGFILIVSLGIALGFTWVFGAWPILPFAGLEMAGLYLAFRFIDRHARDYERVALVGDTLRLEVVDGDDISSLAFNRYWTRLCIRQEKSGPQIALRYKGREFAVGRHRDEEGKRALARALAFRLHC